MNEQPRPLRPTLPRDPVVEDVGAQVREIHNKAIMLRTAARQDATIVVARARERGGAKSTAWSAFDADAVHLITDLLLKLQGQEPTPLDPAFQQRDNGLRAAAGLTGRIEEAIKRGERGEQVLEAGAWRPQGVEDAKADGSSET
jgi:hypothetical protein